jgi:hypothetical protein
VNDDDEPEVLTSLILTVRERLMLERALTMTMAMVDALGDDDTRDLMRLWERVTDEGVPS